MSEIPMTFRWDGEAMVPASSYWAARADRQYVVGEVYRMVEHHDRSGESHRHYFATLANGWANLPDDKLDEYPTPEHLRKKLLVWCGYADERSIVCASKAEAQRVYAVMGKAGDTKAPKTLAELHKFTGLYPQKNVAK